MMTRILHDLPMEETFFASRFAMLRDKFGTSWMSLHPKPQAD
jgi:PhnB protein